MITLSIRWLTLLPIGAVGFPALIETAPGVGLLGAVVSPWTIRTARPQRLARGALACPGDVLPALPWSCGGRWQD
jgi:hypothetical protein